MDRQHAESPSDQIVADQYPDNDSLRAALRLVDEEGWDGPAGRSLLRYVRATMIRPLVLELGLRGAAATQAEATAWEEVWLALDRTTTRQAASPWGVIWQTTRRSVLGEVMAATYATTPAKAWRERKQDTPRPRPGGLHDDELIAALDGSEVDDDHHDVLTAAVAALQSVGWDQDVAARIVEDVLLEEPSVRSLRLVARSQGWAGYGWRGMAERLGIPAWQARRLTLALRGSPDQPGLLPRLILAGGTVEVDETQRDLLRQTRQRRSTRAAAAVGGGVREIAQRRAS